MYSTTARFLAFIIAATSLVGCQRDYDFERQESELRTLGHEIHAIWRKDAERSAENSEAKVQMLDEEYVDFVDAVDAMAPEAELDAVNGFLQNMMTIVDEGFLPNLTRKLVVALLEAASDFNLLATLASPSGPDPGDFITPTANPNFLGYATEFSDLPALTSFGSRAILENDGLTDIGTRTFDEPSAISDLTRILVNELRNLEPAKEDESLPLMVRDLLLIEDERFGPDEPTIPLWAANFDKRGYPLAVTDEQGIAYPLTDADGDGLADVDGSGNFVLRDGTSVMVRPFASTGTIEEGVTRDSVGRAQNPSGDVFEYVDLHKTGLGFLIREFHGLAKKDTLYDMLTAFQTIMGTQVAARDEIGGYKGYPADQPLMDLTYAAVNTLDFEGLGDLLEGFAELMDRYTTAIATLLWNLDNFLELVDEFPDAELGENSTMMADIIPYLNEISADPELWADVMDALRDPVTEKTGDALATLIRFSDTNTVPATDGPYDSCFQQCRANYSIGTIPRYDCIRGCPNGEIFSRSTDYDAAESPETRSQLQQFMHLLRDTAGVPYAMEIEEARVNGNDLPALPPLIALPGAAEAMVASIAGNLDLADYVPDEVWSSSLGELLDLLGINSGNVADMISVLSELFGTALDRVPRPDQITRLFNQPNLRFETDSVVLDIEEPRCKDGYKMAEHLAYGLFVAEASGTIDTVYPLAKAFSDHQREDLMTGLFVVLHEHYSSRTDLYLKASGAASEMKGANLRSYEPAMEQAFGGGEFFPALRQFAIAVKDTEDATGIAMEESMRRLVYRATERDGFTAYGEEPGTPVMLPDNTQIGQPSRLDQMLASIDQASDRLDEEPEARDRLSGAVSNVTELLIGAEKDTNGIPTFKHRGSVAVTVHSSRWLADRVREKEAEPGGVGQWVEGDLVPMLEDLWASRFLTSAVDLASNTLSNEADRATLDAYIDYQFGSREGTAQFVMGVYQLLVQAVNTSRFKPIGNFLADIIDPDREWDIEPYESVAAGSEDAVSTDRLPIVSLVGHILARTLELDPDNDGIFLIHRALDADQGRAPIDVIVDVVARYLSPDPMADSLTNADDYGVFFLALADYLADDVNGLERLYEVVDMRARD